MPSSDDLRKPDAGHGEKPAQAPAQTTERRADPRQPAEQPATIKLLNPLHTSERISATVVDISKGGLRLRLDQSLMPGMLVQIRLGEKLLLGEIRYCTPAGDEFHAGVRLQDVFETGPGA